MVLHNLLNFKVLSHFCFLSQVHSVSSNNIDFDGWHDGVADGAES